MAEGAFKLAILGEVIRDYLRRHVDSPLGAGLSRSPADDLARQTDPLLEVDDVAWRSQHLQPTTAWIWTQLSE
jgi:hypothetical protein